MPSSIVDTIAASWSRECAELALDAQPPDGSGEDVGHGTQEIRVVVREAQVPGGKDGKRSVWASAARRCALTCRNARLCSTSDGHHLEALLPCVVADDHRRA